MYLENIKQKNLRKLIKRERDEIYLKTIDECFRLEKPITRNQIIKKCLKRINEKELEQNAVLSTKKISDSTFGNYIKKLESLSMSKFGIPLPLETKNNGQGEIDTSILSKEKDGKIKTKSRPFATYYYADKSFSLFDRVLSEGDRIKLKEIGTYLKNMSSIWQNDLLEDITKGMEILQMDLGKTEPKVQYELPYRLDERLLILFKKLYQAIERQDVIEFEYDRHNIPGEEYFNNKSIEEIQEFKLKVNYKVTMSPYFLKQSNNRWFLLGKSHDQYLEFEDYLMPISIERLKTLKTKPNIDFQPNPKISLDAYYSNLIGISLERNNEKKNCWFFTSSENLQKIQNLSKTKYDVIFKSSKIFNVSEKEKEIKKHLKMALNFKNYNKEEHLLMDFRGKLPKEIFQFIKNHEDVIEVLFPYTIERDNFIVKNIQYMAIQIPNYLFGFASEIGFDLITPRNEDFGKISAQEILQRKFRNIEIDLFFGESQNRRNDLLLVFRENLKVDTNLISTLKNREVKDKISILSPNTILRNAISKQDIKNIVLEVDKSFAHYIISKPFHDSQKNIEFYEIKGIVESTEIGFKWSQKENEKATYFHLRLIPNKELENLILSKGDQVKVLHPISFKNKITARIKTMYKNYQNSKSKN